MKFNRIWLVVVTMVVLLSLGIVAHRVGGIAIRGEYVTTSHLELQLSTPVVPGVPVTVRWPSERLLGPLVWNWRTEAGEEQLQVAHAQANQVKLIFPCSGEAAGTLVMRELNGGQVLGYRAVELWSPGVECVRK